MAGFGYDRNDNDKGGNIFRMQDLSLLNAFKSELNAEGTKTEMIHTDNNISSSVSQERLVEPEQMLLSLKNTATLIKQQLQLEAVLRKEEEDSANNNTYCKSLSHKNNNNTLVKAKKNSFDDAGTSNNLEKEDCKGEKSSSCVHRACQLFPKTVDTINSALINDIDAIRRYEKLNQLNSRATMKWGLMRGSKIPLFNSIRKRRIMESYQLPINIALKYKASIAVISLLTGAGPDALLLPDGNEGSYSLSIALNTKQNDLDVIQLLLVSNPKCVMVADRRQNYPLHIACSKGSNLHVIRLLYMKYPEAVLKKNFHGDTPLDIARRNTVICGDDVVEFLQRCNQRCKKSIVHI